MADRTVTVRLRALVDDYKKAMGDAGRATQTAIQKADGFKKLGQSTANLGDSLTRSVTLPLVAVGAAAVKMSLDFDSTFAQMQATAGVAASEVAGLKEEVLSLAGETARSPQELAEALMMIRSSGFDGAAAMDVLEMSAKGAASGMGTTAEVANAITNVLNGYGQANITAAEAMDVLTASVQEGKAEASEMAPQFGRLVPIAAELGVSFSDVGGSLAYLTKATGDASQSSTALQGILSKLLRPSQQGAQALEDIGISASELREMLAERGLHGTLMALREQLGDSGFQMLFDDVQALNGALQMTGPGAEDAAAVIDAVGDSAGATQTAFEKMAESAGFQNAQAFSRLQAALITFGDAVVPVVAQAAEWLGKLAQAFADLPGPVRTGILVLAGVAAAIGPILSIGGRVVSAVAAINKAFAGGIGGGRAFAEAMNVSGQAARTASSSLSGLGMAAGAAVAIIGVGLAIDAAEKAAERASRLKAIDDLAEQFLATGDASDELSRALEGNFDAVVTAQGTFHQLLETNLAAAERFIDAAEAAGFEEEAIASLREALDEKIAAERQSAADSETNTRATEDAADAFTEEAAAVEAAVQALQDYSDALSAQFDPMFGMMDALTGNADANRALTDAQNALNEARDSGDPAAIAEAERGLAAAQREAVGSALEVSQATATMNQAIAENPALLEESKAQLATWVDQGLITQATADEMAQKFDLTALRAAALNESDANVEVSSTGTAETGERLEGVTKRATAIPKSRNTATTTTGTDRSRGSLDGVSKAANAIPRSRSTTTGTTGTSGARSSLEGVARAANSIPKNVTTTTTVITKHVGGPIPKRAEGGPVRARQTYLVGEDGPELLTMGAQSGTVHPNSMLDKISSDLGDASILRPVAAYGESASTTVVQVNMAGAIIASEAEAQRWVAKAWNKAASFGMVNVRGRALA